MKHAVSPINARSSHLGCQQSQAKVGAVLNSAEGFYFHDGKVWRKRTHHEVPSGNHSVTDIQAYVRNLPQDKVVSYTNPADFPQYDGILDYVNTMRVASELKVNPRGWQMGWKARARRSCGPAELVQRPNHSR